jgi:hypothetical protein
MAQPLNVEQLTDQVRLPLQGTAKHALHKLWGPEGPPWGTSFDDLEELSVQIGQLVARELLRQALDAQAQTPPPDPALLCPCCGRAAAQADPEPHPATTRAGSVSWSEPARTCGHCRKAFSPSEQAPGH